MMKIWLRFILLFLWIFVAFFFQWSVNAWWFENWSVEFLDQVADKANRSEDQDVVQNTLLDSVTSNSYCENATIDSRYTFSNTLCWIKNNIDNYLQYAVYIWLTVATILLVWNGLKLVVSKDNQKEFDSFKKNLISIAIWVILLVAFYYIIEIFVSVVNLVAV